MYGDKEVLFCLSDGSILTMPLIDEKISRVQFIGKPLVHDLRLINLILDISGFLV